MDAKLVVSEEESEAHVQTNALRAPACLPITAFLAVAIKITLTAYFTGCQQGLLWDKDASIGLSAFACAPGLEAAARLIVKLCCRQGNPYHYFGDKARVLSLAAPDSSRLLGSHGERINRVSAGKVQIGESVGGYASHTLPRLSEFLVGCCCRFSWEINQ